MRSVVVIGGAGYIGPVVIQQLLSAGCRVTCLDLLLYGNGVCVLPFVGNPNFRFVHGDMGDPAAMSAVLDGATDVVLLAGLVGDPITKKYPKASHAINDLGVSRCLDSLNGRGLDRVIFVSTCSNYGLIGDDELADEDFPLNPLSAYATAKVAAERRLLDSRGHVDYTPTILRFATAFGLAPRMRFDLTVNEFTRDLAVGEELLVFDAHTWRPYCHVRDFARLIALVLAAPADDVGFEVFNAGGDANNFTKQGVIDLICSMVPGAKVRYQEHGSDPRNYRVNFEKVRRVLNFEPSMSVAAGVSEILDAMRGHLFDGTRGLSKFHTNIEIDYAGAHHVAP